MTIWSQRQGSTGLGRRAALWALWAALPILATAYQVCAKLTAGSLAGTSFGPQWLAAAIRLPSVGALVLVELASFAAWMTVLSQIKLAAAVPLSAVNYVLVVLAGWTVFHEPATAPQVIGGAAILAGVWLIARDEPED
jgi:drug/metabolite transporter (DMT)-like permease